MSYKNTLRASSVARQRWCVFFYEPSKLWWDVFWGMRFDVFQCTLMRRRIFMSSMFIMLDAITVAGRGCCCALCHDKKGPLTYIYFHRIGIFYAVVNSADNGGVKWPGGSKKREFERCQRTLLSSFLWGRVRLARSGFDVFCMFPMKTVMAFYRA